MAITESVEINYHVNPGAYYVSAVIPSLFSEEEQKEYAEAVSRYDDCFRLAKQNQTLNARQAYHTCRQVTEKLSPSLLHWLLAFYGQRLCYFHYKVENYAEGIALTHRIMESVAHLVQNGYEYLFFVEIQQKLNLARIYFQSGNMQTAVSLCTGCIMSMYESPVDVSSEKMIDQIPEQELIKITRYGMIVEVLSETCNRILYGCKEDSGKLGRLVSQFVSPLLTLDFISFLEEPRYESVNRFVRLLSGLSSDSEIQDEDILFFMQNPQADRKLLSVFNNLINYHYG